jgi:TolA-binding protein
MQVNVYMFLAGALSVGLSAQIALAQKRKEMNWSDSGQKQQMTLPETQKSLFESMNENKLPPAVMGPSKAFQVLKSPNEDYNQYNQILDQQMVELRKLLKKTSSEGAKKELLLRLAELYVEKADLTKMIIEQQHESSGASASKLPNYAPARTYNEQAVKIYEQYYQKYPKDPRTDQVLYFLGYNYFELGDTKKGFHYYSLLDNQYANSRFIVESRFALAEYYFENNKFQEALKYYDFVIKGNNRRLAKFALYKRAWCFYKLGEGKKGIIDLEKIITAEKKLDKNSQEIRLGNEARRDIILFYSEAGPADRAKDYFLSLFGVVEGIKAIEKLAYLYNDRGDIESARTLFVFLIQQNPTHPKSFDYQYQIVRSFSTAKDTKRFKEELYRWVTGYGPNSEWHKANINNKPLIAKASELLEKTLRTWTLQQHQTAQNSRGSTSQDLAESGYRLYFSHFPQSTNAVEMHFYFGELLYDMNKYDQASVEYRWVVENGGNSKYRPMAAANILVSAEKALPKEKALIEQAEKNKGPIPLSSAVTNYINQGNWFISSFPQDQKVPETTFRIGRLYYLHNQFDAALPYFRKVVQNYPDTKYAEYSANLLLDIHNLRSDMEGLRKEAALILSVPAIARSGTGEEIRKILEKADFKKAQDLEKSQNFAESAKSYETFAAQSKDPELVSMALFNAAVSWDKAGRGDGARKNISLLLSRQDAKAKELNIKSLALLIKIHMNAGRLTEAAKAQMQLHKLAQTDKEKEEALLAAGILYEALSEPRSAELVYITWEREFPQSAAKSAETWYRLAEVYREQGERAKARFYYQKFFEKEGRVLPEKVWSCYYLVIWGDQKLRNDDCYKIWSRLGADEKKKSAAAVAKLELNELKVLYKKLYAVRLKNAASLKQDLDKKVAILDEINQLSANIVKKESGLETLESIEIVAHANVNIYEEILNSPAPQELKSEEKIKEYKEQLRNNDMVKGFLRNAVSAYELIWEKARSFDVYAPVVLRTYEQLVKLKPESFVDWGVVTEDDWRLSWVF